MMVVGALEDLVCLGDSSSAADNNHKKLSRSESKKKLLLIFMTLCTDRREKLQFFVT